MCNRKNGQFENLVLTKSYSASNRVVAERFGDDAEERFDMLVSS